MNEFPLVSIVIPVYNGSEYMREAIDSALAQTYKNVEIIVVNDGSSDGGKTREIALSYGKQIRYFEKENGGVSTALNLALCEMKGEYFSWLSHDDVYYPDKIEAEIDALKENGNMDLGVYSGWDALIMPERKVEPYESAEIRYDDKIMSSGTCAVCFGLISGCSLLIPKSYFEKYGDFDESLRGTQDYKKWFEMFAGKRLLYVKKHLIRSRRHSQQQTNLQPRFLQECDELHVWMLKQINEQSMENTELGYETFYSIMYLILLSCGYSNAIDFCLEKLNKKNSELWCQNKMLKQYLNKFNKINLFCAGKNGIGAIKYFSTYKIDVNRISDSNEEKIGMVFNNIQCVSVREFNKEDLLIVTKDNPNEVVESLKKAGFTNVISLDMLYRIIVREGIQ